MKKLFLMPAIIISYNIAVAQQVNQCGIIVPPKTLKSTFTSVYQARDYINTMLDSINWKENFRIRNRMVLIMHTLLLFKIYGI